MNELGPRRLVGIASATNPVFAGGWTAAFTPAEIAVPGHCECYHIAFKGPVLSSVEVWLDETFYDIAARGDKNSWDPNQPMYIRSGTTVFFYWSSNVAPAPHVTIFLREPTGRYL